MRGCKEYIEMANLLPDGLLTAGENERLERHLEQCPDCRRRVEAARAIRAAFSVMPVEPPDTLAPGIKYKLALEPSNKKSWRRFVPGSITVAAACIAFIIIFSQSGGSGAPLFSRDLSENDSVLRGELEYGEFQSGGGQSDPAQSIAPEDDLELTMTSGASEEDGGSDRYFTAAPYDGMAKSQAADDPPGLTDIYLNPEVKHETVPVPDGVAVMGITLMTGDVPEELKEYEAIEEYGFLYILMPSDEYTAFTDANSGVPQDAGEALEPDAEFGAIVFSK